MEGKLIASYRRELSALDDLQCAGTVTYTLTQEADAFVITVQRDGARAAACMLCEIEEERAEMLTRFLYENAVYNNTSWHPSIHMPKEAARIWLKITDVRVERLQDITPKDAKNEGVGNLFYEDIGYSEKNYGTEVDPEYGIAKEQFAWLWDSTIKKSDLDRYGFNANPWVWVIWFERCEKPEGA